MQCLSPVGNAHVKVRLADSWGHDILQEDIKYFIDRGEVEFITLRERQGIIFDDTMGHKSNAQPGFRALANG